MDLGTTVYLLLSWDANQYLWELIIQVICLFRLPHPALPSVCHPGPGLLQGTVQYVYYLSHFFLVHLFHINRRRWKISVEDVQAIFRSRAPQCCGYGPGKTGLLIWKTVLNMVWIRMRFWIWIRNRIRNFSKPVPDPQHWCPAIFLHRCYPRRV